MVRAAWVSTLLALSCGGRAAPLSDGGFDPFSSPACGTATESFSLQLARKVDVLFVVDNSETMAGEQDRLQGHFDAMIGTLAAVPGGFPDSHIGVISTDLGTGPYQTEWCETIGGDAGRLQSVPRGDCTAPSGAYIEVAGTGGSLGGNVADVGGAGGIDLSDVQAAFRCTATLGTEGCRFEQPLEAARLALGCDGSTCANPGFLRPDSLLAVVFLGDEDDCSASDPAVFDPSQNSAAAPLGHFSSYRCFEYGVLCDQPIQRTGGQTFTGCAPASQSAYFHPIERYRDFFSSIRPQGRLLLSAITGPFAPGDEVETELTGGGPAVKASCEASGDSSGIPAIRIHDLVRRFGDDGLVLADHDGLGICGEDFSFALQRIGEAIRGRVSPGCMTRPLVRVGQSGDPLPVALPEEASCSVTETTDGNQTAFGRCEFASQAPVGCSSAEASPGPLASSSGVPCWYVCDSGPPAAGGCSYRWEMRFCHDAACESGPADPAGVRIDADCLSCDLGTLCGDGECQRALGETDVGCAEDCAPASAF